MSKGVIAPPATPQLVPVRLDLTAGLMSYVIPGLGQIVQGRVAKGLLFLVAIYGLFFYGMYLGQWSNVFLGDTAAEVDRPLNLPRGLANVYNRLQFSGQVWIGAAAWPALWHYWNDPRIEPRGSIDTRAEFLRKFQQAPSEFELNKLQREGDKRWDLGWVYTVIAGVLNILVIYDAMAGPAFTPAQQNSEKKPT